MTTGIVRNSEKEIKLKNMFSTCLNNKKMK